MTPPEDTTAEAACGKRDWSRIALPTYWATLFIGSHIPLDEDPVLTTSGYDKIVHFVAYAGLAWLMALASRRPRRWAVVAIVWGIVMAYGFFDEYTQPPFNRTFDPLDLVADGIGAVFGLLVWRFGPVVSRK